MDQDFFKLFFLLFTPGGFGGHRRDTTLSSLRARRTPKTVVKCEFCTLRSNPLVTACSSDAQNCGEMQIFTSPTQPSRHFVLADVQNCGEMRFSLRRRNPLVTLCLSDVQNCGEMQICRALAQPFRCFVLIGRPKL